MTSHPGGNPVIDAPLRRPGSLRRTTTHDATRPDGIDGPVGLVAIGRDLLTGVSGKAEEIDFSRLDARVDYMKTMILSVDASPAISALTELVGKSAYVGFRKSIDDILPGEMESHSVRAQLFDDFPAAVMANGRALRSEGKKIDIGGGSAAPRKLPVNICAGWAEGGTLLAGHSELGPPLHVGPNSPSLDSAADPLGWHELPVLSPHSTRRARRLDVWEEDGRAWADCFFRDSHVDRHGVHTIVHEWRLHAQIDLAERTFVSVRADSGPLPYPECPGSGASAERLAGMPVDGLRRAIRKAFVGPSTCTHLNDSYRAMEDVGALLDRLSAAHETA
jgi:hypothetical protein